MPTPIDAAEDELIALIKAKLAGTVKKVEDAPANWTKDMVLRAIKMTPAVFVSFTGGAAKQPGSETPVMDAGFSLIVATGHASGERARRRGDTREIGAYELIATIVPLLNGYNTAAGTLQFRGTQPVDVSIWDLQNLMLWEIQFGLPMFALEEVVPDGALDNFRIFHVDYDVAPPDGQLEATDDIEIEQ